MADRDWKEHECVQWVHSSFEPSFKGLGMLSGNLGYLRWVLICGADDVFEVFLVG